MGSISATHSWPLDSHVCIRLAASYVLQPARLQRRIKLTRDHSSLLSQFMARTREIVVICRDVEDFTAVLETYGIKVSNTEQMLDIPTRAGLRSTCYP
ncbi:hypothetical protein ARMGADRAFT_760186 [Armillaria gallica]|uniref:Uncharacterized protein n=1 Tax=Armillaria gallica TaxID=47427 RepID=A0A2H3DLY8_ARMGA|nr:hypothetical protein ARMGADRAFT_760186 [Armillaria gallica]